MTWLVLIPSPQYQFGVVIAKSAGVRITKKGADKIPLLSISRILMETLIGPKNMICHRIFSFYHMIPPSFSEDIINLLTIFTMNKTE